MKHPYMGVIAPSTVLLPIGVALIRRQIIRAEIKVLFYFLLTSAAVYLVSTLLAVNHRSNTQVIHIDTIIESLFLLRFYYLIVHNASIKKWVIAAAVLFPLFCIINIAAWQGWDRHNTYSRPLGALIFMTLSVSYWWQPAQEETVVAWSSAPLNWIISGLLLYFTSSFFLFLFSNFLAYRFSHDANVLVWNIHATLVIIMHLMFTIGLIKCNR
jgi:hypothetical protein